MVVLEFAKTSRATCRTCNKFIEQDSLKIGTTVSNEGFLNVEWHHEDCFWEKRIKSYYKRKNKKINIVVKVEQFSNLHILDDQQRRRLEHKLREANLKNATPAALEKAGIVADHAPAEEPEPEAPAAPPATKKGGRGKKRTAAAVEEEAAPEEEPAGAPAETTPPKAKRGAKKGRN
jgi:hypothetical protein